MMDFLFLMIFLWLTLSTNQTIQLRYDDGDVYYYQTSRDDFNHN